MGRPSGKVTGVRNYRNWGHSGTLNDKQEALKILNPGKIKRGNIDPRKIEKYREI